ncbi:MAG: histidinol-phosphatase HisJ family protein [Clostridia bacterium]|nr:histidinol-phosphatase HisJ family protein [Clostridia bacterium]
MSKVLSDFHTHTKYCDGKNTVFEMAERAYALGFSTLGFSGHGFTVFDESYCMSRSNTESYIRDVLAARESYRGRMSILLGTETDIFDPVNRAPYDYIIASSHYLRLGEEYLPIDCSLEDFSRILTERFDGNFARLAEQYYTELTAIGKVCPDADIIGHLDLVTKYSDVLNLPLDNKYFDIAISAAEELSKLDMLFEINVGAITRGYRTTPYPAAPILKRIRECGGRIIITGDCHDAKRLGDHFDTALALARECGFASRFELSEGGVREAPIK